MANLPPAARQLFLGLGHIGYKALSAAVRVGLGELANAGETVIRRVRAGEAAADRMSKGQPYTREDEEP
jgi:hypothetical protein